MREQEVVRTTVYLPKNLYLKAKEFGINFSRVMRDALIVEISLQELSRKKRMDKYLDFRLAGKDNYIDAYDLEFSEVEDEWNDESGAP